MSNRPFITLDAMRNEAGAEFIRVALFGFTLVNYAPDEEEQAFSYCYGFARAAIACGAPEPLPCWNLDWETLRANPDHIGEAHLLNPMRGEAEPVW